jgi:serine/threonine protein kinase
MSQGRRYHILGVLGKGGFGTVYKAELLGEGGFKRKVALKVLNADMRDVDDVASRLRDEARLLGLLRHRSILGVDGLVRLNGRWTVVMEYIDGADLQRITRKSCFPLGPALEVIGEVAGALHVAYATESSDGKPLRLLHRDIKPPNILLTSAGEVKVLDFGIARAEFSDREAKTQSVLYGSVAYMAPERLDFEELPAGDVYALGTVLFELLTAEQFGRASIRGEKHQLAVERALETLKSKVKDCPEGFVEMIGSMLSYEPSERPSAREVERRCRVLRGGRDDDPYLRDWAEMVIPEVMRDMSSLKQDDFSGSVVMESISMSATIVDESQSDFEGTDNRTYFVENSSSDKGRKESGQKGSGLMRYMLGGSLVGCVGLTLAGGLIVLLAVLFIVWRSGNSVETTQEVGNRTTEHDTPKDELAEQAPDAALNDPANENHEYGPPTGFQYRVKLTKNWVKFKFPIGKGNITYSDEKTLVVMYGGGPLKPLSRRYAECFSKRGWTSEMTYEGETAVTRTIVKDKKKMAISVVPSQGNTLVSISRM